jgi:hypothetical protein
MWSPCAPPHRTAGRTAPRRAAAALQRCDAWCSCCCCDGCDARDARMHGGQERTSAGMQQQLAGQDRSGRCCHASMQQAQPASRQRHSQSCSFGSDLTPTHRRARVLFPSGDPARVGIQCFFFFRSVYGSRVGLDFHSGTRKPGLTPSQDPLRLRIQLYCT